MTEQSHSSDDESKDLPANWQLFEPTRSGRIKIVALMLGLLALGQIPEGAFPFAGFGTSLGVLILVGVVANYIYDGQPEG